MTVAQEQAAEMAAQLRMQAARSRELAAEYDRNAERWETLAKPAVEPAEVAGEAAETPTAAAFADPKPGDRFHEMYSFWMHVLEVEPDGGPVVVMHAHPPCSLPEDGIVVAYASADEFRKAYAYKGIPGYTVHLADRGNGVAGWREKSRRAAAPSAGDDG